MLRRCLHERHRQENQGLAALRTVAVILVHLFIDAVVVVIVVVVVVAVVVVVVVAVGVVA